MADVINKCTTVELEHPDTGKICLANCVCCANSRQLEKGLFADSPATYICTEVSRYKKSKHNKKQEFPILMDLNYCCSRFELSRDFMTLGYKVVGKYSVKIAGDKKVVK